MKKLTLTDCERESRINNILEGIKSLDLNITNISMKENCIYAETIKENGDIEVKGLYAMANFKDGEINKVYNGLKCKLNLLS